MKKRILKKKWNKEIKDFKISLKREKHYSHNGIFKSYECYEGDFSWSDIYFIGTFNGVKRLFNACIVSQNDAFEDELYDKVENIVEKEYPNYLNDIYSDDLFTSGEIFKIKNKELYDKVDKLRIKHSKIIGDIGISISSFVKAEKDYSHGIGLNIVTNSKYLNKDIITDYVKIIQNLNIKGYDKHFLEKESSLITNGSFIKSSDRLLCNF